MLRDMDEKGRIRKVAALDYPEEFEKTWNRIPRENQLAIENEISRKLDELVASPESKWGSIMNTSIEGGRTNPFNGKPGDWSGTPYHAIYVACGESHQQSALFFGSVWKKAVIDRPEQWIGIRNTAHTPTFPQKGIVLQGKTYFLDRKG
jgi:hypothetical protein